MRHKHKIVCSLLVTLSLLLLPLPTLADTTPPADASSESAANTPLVVNSTTPLIESSTSLPSITTDTSVSAPDAIPAAALELQTPQSVATINVNNTTTSDATTGHAAVTDNEVAGDATSGQATASTTVLNVANANGATTPAFNTFQCDITGEEEDDIVIDPASLLPICHNTSVGASAQTASTTQGVQTGASLIDILNNIVLSATSGDATVADNEVAGNATTGEATTIANLVNIANTNITSKQAFLGIINIFGNLKGDILVPQYLVDGLTSPSGAPASGIDTTSITNSINASAQSGNATVSGNESAGDATTGEATTNITVLNLTGQEVVAKNSLLVFVNVLGKWMGMIVPAPGSITATLGSSLQGAAEGHSAQGNSNGDETVNITNNITLAAQSGNATVSGNETGGNATSGAAKAGANILNITNSNFLLDDWFGALFINVLGTWLGDFDIQKALAEQSHTVPPQVVQDIQVYQITEPTPIAPIRVSVNQTSTVASDNQPPIKPQPPLGEVLSSSTITPQETSSPKTRTATTDFLTLAGLVVALTIIIAAITAGLRRKLLA